MVMDLSLEELKNLRVLLDRVTVKGVTESAILASLARRIEQMIAEAQKPADG